MGYQSLLYAQQSILNARSGFIEDVAPAGAVDSQCTLGRAATGEDKPAELEMRNLAWRSEITAIK